MNHKKPIPFHVLLNQPPRSPHGRNRQATSSSYRNPSHGADPSTGTEDDSSAAIATWRSIPVTFAHPPKDSGAFANLMAQFQKDILDRMSRQTQQTLLYGRPNPSQVPYEGVHVGEIIGLRAWWLMAKLDHEGGLHPFLSSLGHLREWKPDETVSGDINEVILPDSLYPIYGGVYSFTSSYAMWSQLGGWISTKFPTTGQFRSVDALLYGIVIGSVKCWGEVVEHEYGMRAQYAKLASIDQVFGEFSKEEIEAIYLSKETKR